MGYRRVQIALHWAIAVVIAANYLLGDDMGRALRTHLQGGEVGLFPAMMHVWLGLAVLVLVALRLGVRLILGVPEAPAGDPELLRRAGHLVHVALYVLMIAMPVFGVLAWYAGIGVAGDAHEIAANLIMLLAGLHAVAALFHHYVLGDGLMWRMLRAQSRH
ncbi:MAG: cytochrome b [Rhodobacterales bacterium]|nr:cytochrome b [Rhodobacterales bacterium]NCT11582.1 cytochrome b [Rhodobacterales bacterium]